MNCRVHLFISGRVQGVFFRWTVKQKARKIRIRGWVKNLPDGQVEAILESEKEKAEELIEWIKKGVHLAKVDDIKIKWEDYQNEFDNFEVRY